MSSKPGYTKRSFSEPFPESHSVDGKKLPPDGDAQPEIDTERKPPWIKSKVIGGSVPEGQDLGPYIEYRGESIAQSFSLDFLNSIPYATGNIHVHTGLLLFSLALNLNPDIILETGTCFGYSTLFLAKACEVRGKGMVYTIDPDDSHIGDEIRNHPHVICVKDRSTNCLPLLLELVGQVDFAFIDSWKRLAEYEFYQIQRCVPEGGVICFHDTQLLNTGETLYADMVKLNDYERILFAGTPHNEDPHVYYGNADDRGLLVMRRKEKDPFLRVADAGTADHGAAHVFPTTIYESVEMQIRSK